MHAFVHQLSGLSRVRRSTKHLKWLAATLVLVGLALVSGWWRTVQASQRPIADAPGVADQGTAGIAGYVVGNGPVAAYACPDTATCAVRLTLKPGTVVLIVDNVVGGKVPGLNDTTWRKIVYQGQTVYVPLVYIKVGRPGGEPDISLVQTSFEDDSTTAPGAGSSFSTVPSSIVPGLGGCGPGGCGSSCPPGQVVVGVNLTSRSLICCPQAYRYNPTANPSVACIAPPTAVTFYAATDGRIDGNAGDRIAIYCRRTGRIEVWSVNNSQGHFLVEFNHLAVDAAGKAGFTVTVPGQGIVAINGDGHGTYWAALNAGPYHATSAGDFAKTFQCYLST